MVSKLIMRRPPPGPCYTARPAMYNPATATAGTTVQANPTAAATTAIQAYNYSYSSYNYSYNSYSYKFGHAYG